LAVFNLNPLTPLLMAFRWSLIGTPAPHWGYLAYAVAVAGLVLLGGAFAFKKMERKFADVI
jgi:lipopolysaccharide transport system permease protein